MLKTIWVVFSSLNCILTSINDYLHRNIIQFSLNTDYSNTYSVITDHSSQRWFDSFASVVVLAVGVFTHHCFPIQDISHPTLNRLLSIDCDGQLECNGA